MYNHVVTNSPLVLGPLLRYVDETSASIWLETDARGVATVALDTGRSVDSHTFTVHGHHYALVDIEDLAPGSASTYTVSFEGVPVWPQPDSPFPASTIRTIDTRAPLRLTFGSCRTSVPHDAAGNRAHGVDVLRAFSLRLRDCDPAQWPALVMLLGDQVYADETSDTMREFIRSRRDIEQPPYEELKDYYEYAHLYRLAWTDPANRWLLSTVPTAMIFDDHDIRDDWNTSYTWRQDIRKLAWWHDRIVGGLASYWVYQHIGNLSPAERASNQTLAEVRKIGAEGDAGGFLNSFAETADRDPDTTQWSYSREIGNNRIIMLDSRCARVLRPGSRQMLDDEEMAWFEELATGDVDHLIIGTSLPFLLPMGLHHLEAWNEAVSEGVWGKRSARFGEKVRQAVDLEHWAAFQLSFQRVARIVSDVALGRRGRAPATVVFLSGDVHHSYLAEVELPSTTGRSRLLQAVCSPIRNPMPRTGRLAAAAASYGLAWPMGRLVARSAHVPAPPFRWRITNGPWFSNCLATMEIDGRRARVTWESAAADGGNDPELSTIDSVTLA
jgi:hypothetical protein